MNPSTSRDRDSAARTSSSGCSPVSTSSTCRSPCRADRSTDRTKDAKCGLVMSGTIDRDVARAPGDQAAGGTVRHEAELAHRRLDPAAGLRSHLLGHVDGARHGGRMHTGACRNVEDRRSLLALHDARPYTASSVAAEGTDDGRRTATVEHAARWHAHAPTTLPDYDRTAAPVIAHLGFGAFARAHLAVYADELLRRGQPALIRGVSIRSRRAQDQLEPQDGLFTVAVREPGDDTSLQVIGALASMETGAAAALEAMTAPTTRLVTLTITEKGYEATPRRRRTPRRCRPSAPALIALALAQRRRDGLAPPVFASARQPPRQRRPSCAARVLDGRRADRPAPRGVDRPRGAASPARSSTGWCRRRPSRTWRTSPTAWACSTGLPSARNDTAPGSCGPSTGWLPLADVGVELVDDVDPLRATQALAPQRPAFRRGVRRPAGRARHHRRRRGRSRPSPGSCGSLVDDTLEVAEFPASLQPAAFADEALRRFANPTLGHTCAQVGADGSSKLPQRLLPVVAARRERALDTWRFAVVAAVWIAATAGVEVAPCAPAPTGGPDRGGAPRRLHGHGSDLRRNSADVALGAHSDPAFAAEVASMLARLTTEGPALLGAER